MTKTICPHCGVLYTIGEKNYTFESSRKLPNMAMAPPMQAPSSPPPGFSARRETPAYLPSTEAHISIPFRQSMIFGLFKAPVGGIVAWGLTYLLDASSKSFEPTTWGYIFLTGAGALVVGFWVASQEWPSRLGFYDSLLWKIEEATQQDVDGDGHVGEPPAQAPTVKVEMVQENGVPRKLQDLPVDLIRLKKLAHLIIMDKRGFAEATAKEAGIGRDDFINLREVLIKQGWAGWKHPTEPRQGVEVNREGVNIFRTILSYKGGEDEGATAPKPTPDPSSLNGRYLPIEQ